MLRLDMHMIAEVSQYVAVASFAEAWIEIFSNRLASTGSKVASFAEAWIEISKKRYLIAFDAVASFAEAWIEILIPRLIRILLSSPPSRRRGLKSSFVYTFTNRIPSPPSRRRGLKLLI